MTDFTEEWIRQKQFKLAVENEVQHQPETNLDKQIIDRQLPGFIQSIYPDKKDVNIMDIGCNEGYAMSKFKELGYENIQGITVKKEEWDICKEKGLNVHHMNYNFSKMMDGFFQVIWMRQSIQFSPMPFFTMLELNRILKMNGWLYIEFPDMSNTNRFYGTLGKENYKIFLLRSGFEIIQEDTMEISAGDAKENHHFFIVSKRRNVKLPEIDSDSSAT